MDEEIYSVTTLATDAPEPTEEPPLVYRALRAGLPAAILGFGVAWLTLPSSGHSAAASLLAGVGMLAMVLGSVISLLVTLVLMLGAPLTIAQRSAGALGGVRSAHWPW